jgi:glutathione S-transferase
VITLYELHWSHYCEKIRWALDYKKLPWKKVGINAFTKKEMKKFPCTQERYLVPLIYDENTKTAIGDSSPILKYLEEVYPESSPLFFKNSADNSCINEWLLELDSKLGVIGRRLGYTQLILENPTILSKLFLPDVWGGVFTLPFIRRISSAFLAMILIKRFRFELSESLGLYEELEVHLLTIAEKLKNKKFLVNNTFSAADLTLAVYLRPLNIVPFFNEHPALTDLFKWQKDLLREHNRETRLLYEVLLEEHRKTHPPMRRKIRDSIKASGFLKSIEQQISENNTSFNDHEPIWTWRMLRVPYYYFFKIKKNKVRQKYSSNLVR